MISLSQIIPVLSILGISDEHIQNAIEELKMLLDDLDEVEVKGRQNLNNLLGCIMALETIIKGEDGNG